MNRSARVARTLCWLASLLVLGDSGQLWAARQEPRATCRAFPPRDESVRQSDLKVFLDLVRRAVARRDVETLVRLAAPDVALGFGSGDEGRARFKVLLSAGELWPELDAVLSMGGTFPHGVDDVFSVPYVYSAWPDEFDGFEHVAILGTGVRVRERPDLAAPTIATMSHCIVPLADGGPAVDAGRWATLRLADGRVGFVTRRYVRSPVEYRLVFTRAAGRWRIASFLAGD